MREPAQPNLRARLRLRRCRPQRDGKRTPARAQPRLTPVIAELVTGSVVGALMSVPGVRHARRRVLGRVGQRDQPATFLFADLVGYTALTERCGDDQAAHIARAFARGVSVLSRQHGARHVKSTGDGAMIWAPDAGEAVALAARLVSELGTRPDLLPVRVGAYTGAAIRQDGDWYGR